MQCPRRTGTSNGRYTCFDIWAASTKSALGMAQASILSCLASVGFCGWTQGVCPPSSPTPGLRLLQTCTPMPAHGLHFFLRSFLPSFLFVFLAFFVSFFLSFFLSFFFCSLDAVVSFSARPSCPKLVPHVVERILHRLPLMKISARPLKLQSAFSRACILEAFLGLYSGLREQKRSAWQRCH